MTQSRTRSTDFPFDTTRKINPSRSHQASIKSPETDVRLTTDIAADPSSSSAKATEYLEICRNRFGLLTRSQQDFIKSLSRYAAGKPNPQFTPRQIAVLRDIARQAKASCAI